MRFRGRARRRVAGGAPGVGHDAALGGEVSAAEGSGRWPGRNGHVARAQAVFGG